MSKKSRLTNDLDHCIICGRSPVQMHHVFFGVNRKKADELDFIIPLCFEHHTGSRHAIHFDKALDAYWKRRAQEVFEQTGTREQFRLAFGKSYL